MVSQAELVIRVITLWFLVLSQFYYRIDGMGTFTQRSLSRPISCPDSLRTEPMERNTSEKTQSHNKTFCLLTSPYLLQFDT